MTNRTGSDSTEAAAQVTVTQETLDQTPERVMKFLRGVGTVPAIRSALAARGYDDVEHQRGWNLLHAASGYGRPASDFATSVDSDVHAAIAALDAWDEDGFRIVRAALGRLHPEQAKRVLEGIGPSTGAAAVVGVRILLDRLDALAKSKDGGDKKALETLAARGISEAERKRLRGLVAVAERGTMAAGGEPDGRDERKAERQKALVELRAWYEDWSEMAKATIKRRDRLIFLGLAKRKSPKKSAPPAPAPAT